MRGSWYKNAAVQETQIQLKTFFEIRSSRQCRCHQAIKYRSGSGIEFVGNAHESGLALAGTSASLSQTVALGPALNNTL